MKCKVVEVYGGVREHIDVKGKPNKYGEPKIFDNSLEALSWIKKHSYSGMSHRYEIVEVSNG